MLTEYYRPTSDRLASISVALVSCVGFATPHPARHWGAAPGCYTAVSPAYTNATEGFYTTAAVTLDEAAQLAALENFAETLLSEAVEPPQATVDLLNERFWDLV